MMRAFMLNRCIAALYRAANALAKQAGVSGLPTPEPFVEGVEVNDTALVMILNNATDTIDLSRRNLAPERPTDAAGLLKALGITVREVEP